MEQVLFSNFSSNNFRKTESSYFTDFPSSANNLNLTTNNDEMVEFFSVVQRVNVSICQAYKNFHFWIKNYKKYKFKLF